MATNPFVKRTGGLASFLSKYHWYPSTSPEASTENEVAPVLQSPGFEAGLDTIPVFPTFSNALPEVSGPHGLVPETTQRYSLPL